MSTLKSVELNPFDCAKKQQDFHCELVSGDFDRLTKAEFSNGRIRASFCFESELGGSVFCAFKMVGNFDTECQNCLEPMIVEIDKSCKLRCISSYNPDGFYEGDVLELNDSNHFMPLQFIEDEIMLHLASGLKHKNCQIVGAEFYGAEQDHQPAKETLLGDFLQ